MKRLLAFAVFIFSYTFIHAQIPGTLSYQGLLVKSSGEPADDGTHFVQFKFYDALTGGTLKYASTGTGSGNLVTTYKGLFTFTIGSGTAGNAAIPTSVLDAAYIGGQAIFVEITADLVVLSPRVPLTTTPNAFHAQNANAVPASGITGTVSVAQGGTGATSLTGVFIGNGTGAATGVAATGAGQFFRRNAADTGYEFVDLSASNGLTATNGNLSLGGTLAGNTNIASAGFNFTLGGAGKMGISTLTPVNRLDVGGNVAIGNTYAGALSAPTNGAIIEGNVGIGTSSPGYRLHVVGDGTTEASDNVMVEGNGTTTPGMALLRSSGTFAAPTAIAAGDIGQINFIGHNGTSYFTGSMLKGFAESAFTSSSINAGLSFITASGTGALTERMRITAAGNVGIGTTTVNNRLDVEGGAAIGATYSGTNTAPTNGAIIEGNVGIGTNAPAARLDVNGTSVFRGYTSINRTSAITSASVFDVEATALAGGFGGMYVNGTNAASFPFYGYATAGSTKAFHYLDGGTNTWHLSNGGNRLSVTSAGNVGIGTATITNRLDVEGGAAIGANYSGTSTAPTNGLLVEGSVGIGTAAPSFPLSVFTSSSTRGLNIEQDYAGASPQYGINVDLTSATGTSTKYGILNTVSGTASNSSTIYGTYNTMTPNGTGPTYGVTNLVLSAGTGARYGTSNVITTSSTNTSTAIGTENSITTNGSSTAYGTYNSITSSGTAGTAARNGTYNEVYGLAGSSAPIYGDRSYMYHSGSGPAYGIYADVNKAASQAGVVYGQYIISDNDGTGDSYLMYASSIGSTTGTEYGLYVTGEDLNYFAGKVGVGTSNLTTIGTYKLYIVGSGFASGGTWTASDIRYKKNFTRLSSALDKIKKLEGYSYEWRREENPDMEFPEGRHYGFKAQEIEQFFPELISTHQNGYKAMNYAGMTPVLLEAIKEQQTQIEQLQSEITKLKSQLGQYESLSAQVEALKKLVTQPTSQNTSTAGGNK
jgi:hypothetical protein